MVRKPVAAWGTVVLVGLVIVAWQSLGLPPWLFLVVGTAAVVALLVAIGRARRDRKCPHCGAYAGRAFAAQGTRGRRMRPPGDKTPERRWRKENPDTGWSETSYRCSACNSEWQERVDY